MPSLYVYTTEGTCIYPEAGRDDPSINRYFESVNFVADLSDPNSPSIEAYFRATLPSGRPEQLFLRFQSDDTSSVFEDCRRVVFDELVGERGWEIQGTTSSGDPSMVFQRAVLRPPPDPSQVIEGTPLAGRMEQIRAAIHDTREPFTLTGRNYETIADGIRTFSDEPVVIAVIDGDISLSRLGLVFNQESQQHALTLPRGSKQLLQHVSVQEAAGQIGPQEAQRIESELSEIKTQLRAIKDKDVSQSTVHEQLDSVVSDVYPSLSVSAGAVRSALSVGGSGDETDSEGVLPPPSSSEDRLSGIVPNVPDRVAVTAGVGMIVIVLVLVAVGAGTIFGDGNGASGSEFTLESLDAPDEVIAGEEFNVTVEIANEGERRGTRTLNLTSDPGLGERNTTVSLAGGNSTAEVFTLGPAGSVDEYAITAIIGEVNITTTVSVVDNDEDDQRPAETNLSGLDIAGQGENTTIDFDTEENVSVEVENIGNASDSFTVRLKIGDNLSRNTTTDLAVGENDTVTFENGTGSLDPGDYNVTASTDNDEVTGRLIVERPDDNETIGALGSTNAPIEEGEALSVTTGATHVNTGQQSLGRSSQHSRDTRRRSARSVWYNRHL